MSKNILKVTEVSNKQYECLQEKSNGKHLWMCKVCTLAFLKRANTISEKNPKKFCKACNVMRSNRECEKIFLEDIQVIKSIYKDLVFISQYENPMLMGKSKPLRVDIAVLASLKDELPILAIECNENRHSSYNWNQGNLRDYYYKKRGFYKALDIPFIEVGFMYRSRSRGQASTIQKNYKIESLISEVEKALHINSMKKTT